MWVSSIIIIIALFFVVMSFISPEKPNLLKIAVLLICAAMLLGAWFSKDGGGRLGQTKSAPSWLVQN